MRSAGRGVKRTAHVEGPADILRARARVLARPLEFDSTEGMLQVVEFRVAQERYAIETAHVREVHPLKDLTPLPATPAFVQGIVNVRGHIVAVLNLRELLDLPREGLTDLHRIILIEGPQMELGLLADSVTGVRLISAASLQPALPTLTGMRADFLRGLTADHLIVLDVGRLLADPGIVVHEDVEHAQ